MASDRIEWVLRWVDTWNSGDLDGFLDAVGPEFEFEPDPNFPDAGTYSGEQLRRWMDDWAQTWKNNRFEVLDIDERGQTVAIESRWHLEATKGVEEVPISDFTVVLWFDPDDRPQRMAAFFDHQRALEAQERTG